MSTMARAWRTSTCSLIFIFFILLFLGLHSSAWDSVDDGFSRLDFPPDFVFGAGSSAYQVEGAAAEDGRKPSIWDAFVHGGKAPYKGTGDIASDQYHKYKEDVKLMHEMGLDAYRFSISWSRVIPDGHGAVNPKGLQYYNNLIDELLSYGIEPHVTLSHFDVPQALEDEYRGFKGSKFIEDFTEYANVCFQKFGDRVKYWITFNEPNVPGYGFTCSRPFDDDCLKQYGDAETYTAVHNVLLSHAAAVHLYRTKYQEKQKGKIGVTLLAVWYEPLTKSTLDVEMANRSLAFELEWFLDPLVYGRYPAIMSNTLGAMLPNITEMDSKRIQHSFDFIGLNHYTGLYVQAKSNTSSRDDERKSIFAKKSSAYGLLYKDYVTTKADAPGWAVQKLLEYLKQNYQNPASFIHENGYDSTPDDPSNRSTHADPKRVEYLQRNLQGLLPSIRNGSNMKGYFVWSFMDSLEIFGGYNTCYGLYGVDFQARDRRRYPRQSAYWYSSFLAKSGRKRESSSYLYSQ